MAARRAHDWEAALQAVADPSVTYPEYYTQPFHAYEAGNLNWEAALELTLAAQSVHATVMDPAGKTLRAECVVFLFSLSCFPCFLITAQRLTKQNNKPPLLNL